MKKTLRLALCFCVFSFSSFAAFGAVEGSDNPQWDYERSIGAVVRHKHFYKAHHLELGITTGVMPYDSLINYFLVGGRLTWHISDHYGWEIADVQAAFPTVNSFTTNLVSSKGLSNLQTAQAHAFVGSNFLLSPVYGKVRFFGRQVLYFDFYLVAGGGIAKTDVLMFSATDTNASSVVTTVHSGIDPMFDFGLGFKIFMNDALGLVVDLRDYVVSSNVYNTASLKSNFSVFVGLSVFLPTF